MAHHKRRSKRRDKTHWAKCGCCPILTADKEPVKDGPCTGKEKRRKPRPKKDKCPVNRTHEWYVEVITETYHYWDDRPFTRKYRVSTCIYCWKVKKKSLYESLWRISRKKSLPKREVKF